MVASQSHQFHIPVLAVCEQLLGIMLSKREYYSGRHYLPGKR